ncbi:DUF4876 domain-containing protein [Sphingobacterium psychroaquaticum]|uniref:DUF4876 domain-containing protein n=1 Tax=Sphingobacterium psychroaquaticum TaxID=561061 RepID=A0A1X7J1B4_9SPHI|nr:DUF4876 domain-containing protein [Sphingobacterium psychroaquaticum]SMG21287.1 Protein of unknown function [Sphingobacterium psychroaquaticum]
MKTQIKLFLLSIFILGLSSCKKDIEEARPINVQIQLAVDESEVWFNVPFDKAEITMTNKANNSNYKLQADEKGKIALQNIVPGNYNINVSLEITAEEYTKLTGTYRENSFFLNYSLTDQNLFNDQEIKINLINSEPVGGFVIKQIYYAGSHTTRAANIRDQFVEIYNNSADVLYADSLLLVLAYGKTNKNTDQYSLTNNQYDWSKSIGMEAITGNANEDYIYAKAIFMIPSDGTGKKYPVEPGKSIIIAQTAVNHAGSYLNNSGTSVGALDPHLTVDLSKADFEVWLYPYEQKIQPGRTMFASDVDNPDVTDMTTFFATGMRDMVLTPQARESYVLVKVDHTVNIEQLPKFAIPSVRTVSSSTTVYPQIPGKYIVDAVEVEEPTPSDRVPRRLPQRFDAGAIAVPGGQYTSQSVVRKTQKIVNGRRILKDTNNSTNDFGFLEKSNPYKDNSSFID